MLNCNLPWEHTKNPVVADFCVYLTYAVLQVCKVCKHDKRNPPNETALWFIKVELPQEEKILGNWKSE